MVRAENDCITVVRPNGASKIRQRTARTQIPIISTTAAGKTKVRSESAIREAAKPRSTLRSASQRNTALNGSPIDALSSVRRFNSQGPAGAEGSRVNRPSGPVCKRSLWTYRT